jgi:hypothetical protein
MTEFTDQFASLAAWTLGEAGSLLASSNKVGGTADTWPSGVRAFEPGVGNFRIASSINYQAGGVEGHNASVGVANTAGAQEFAGWFTIGIDGKGRVEYKAGGSAAVILGTGLTAGTYLATVTGDEHGVSFTLMKSDRSEEYRFHITRAEVGTIKRVLLFNSDARGVATGNSISPLGAITSLGTVEPRENIEGIGTSRSYSTTDASGRKIRLEFPAAFNSRTVPKGWILFAHGVKEAGLENTPIERAERKAMFKALLEAGYCVASSDLGGESVYGNEGAAKALKELYEYVAANYLGAPILLMGFSGGGTAVAIAIKQNLIPVKGFICISAFLNIKFFEEHRAEEPFAAYVASFREAYGINEAFTNYAEKITTPELDPQALGFASYHGIACALFASPEDKVVPKLNHSDKLKEKLEGHQRLLKEIATTGEHATEGQFPAAAVVTAANELIEESSSSTPFSPVMGASGTHIHFQPTGGLIQA